MAASISCLRSSSTLVRVSNLSGSVSPPTLATLADTVLILTRNNFDVNASFTTNTSVATISFCLGSLLSTRCVGLAMANDCTALISSLSGPFILAASKQHQYDHLICGHLQNVFTSAVLLIGRIGGAKCRLQSQLSAAVFAQVEAFKGVKGGACLHWQIAFGQYGLLSGPKTGGEHSAI
ncbi:hypothetical protein BpHYR1_000451 [Brachionus plicatilis]|uniref:Uncharacterized protein n=1 Tax=Brachionus plicatilis TaxID=10195 RepID=A0A3M7RN24_BRAPC|nr:hypothetical protein BpHYR1_000451 [Brachionus plicatilis]